MRKKKICKTNGSNHYLFRALFRNRQAKRYYVSTANLAVGQIRTLGCPNKTFGNLLDHL